MKTTEKDNIVKNWFDILFGVLAIVALKSIFENDNSKIVSKHGKKILSNENKMNDINKKIDYSKSNDYHKEIII